jgi:hypothetical protein
MDEVIKNYSEKGLSGRFNLDKEFDFIQSHGQSTCDMYDCEYISLEYRDEVLKGLNNRYLKLKCFQQEMFERYSDGGNHYG